MGHLKYFITMLLSTVSTHLVVTRLSYLNIGGYTRFYWGFEKNTITSIYFSLTLHKKNLSNDLKIKNKNRPQKKPEQFTCHSIPSNASNPTATPQTRTVCALSNQPGQEELQFLRH